MEGRCIFNVGVECDAAVPKCETCGWCPDVEKKRHEEAARERAARGKFQSIHYVLDPGAFPPERAHKEDAGLDLRSPVEVTVPAHGSAVIDTGVHMELPVGSCGMLIPKSGFNVRHDIVLRVGGRRLRRVYCREALQPRRVGLRDTQGRQDHAACGRAVC